MNNKKLNCIIIDDEAPARELIKEFCSKIDYINVIDEAENGFDGIKLINSLKPDLVFLDIQMPKLTGFEMIEVLDVFPKIIFSTAYDQYAIKAFEINAVDYLLKPFTLDRFKQAVAKVIQNDNKTEEISRQIPLKEDKLDRIVVKDRTNINIIALDDIQYITAEDDYVYIHTLKHSYLKQVRMKYLEQNLPESFIRIHRSSIINIDALSRIEVYTKDSYIAVLKNNVNVKVSKTGYAKLKEMLML